MKTNISFCTVFIDIKMEIYSIQWDEVLEIQVIYK